MPLFYYFTVQLHLLWVSVFMCVCVCVCVCGGGGVGGVGGLGDVGGVEGVIKFPLLHFGSSVFWVNILDSHPNFYSLKHFIICIFLIHSDTLQRMLTALFKLVWNIQKRRHTNFFHYQGKMFLNIENVWCLNALPYFFSSYFWSKGVKFLLTYNLRSITKQNWH